MKPHLQTTIWTLLRAGNSQREIERRTGTRLDQPREIERLRAYFKGAEFEVIQPPHIAQYRDGRKTKPRRLASGEVQPARPAPVAANRELALFSHFWNRAREWGFTKSPNPVTGVEKNEETPRDYYADDQVWFAVRAEGVQELQDAMDLAYLTGQRPSDVLRFGPRDLVDGNLQTRQGKTNKRLRIRLTNSVSGVRTKLGELVDRLLSRKVVATRFIVNESRQPIRIGALRSRFNAARIAAAAKAREANDVGLAERIEAFQFRDARAKAASEIDDIKHAQELLAHSTEQITRTVLYAGGQTRDADQVNRRVAETELRKLRKRSVKTKENPHLAGF